MSNVIDQSSVRGVNLKDVKRAGVWPWGSLVANEIAGDSVRDMGVDPTVDPEAYRKAKEDYLDRVYIESLGNHPERR